jgi:hypothetical protein
VLFGQRSARAHECPRGMNLPPKPGHDFFERRAFGTPEHLDQLGGLAGRAGSAPGWLRGFGALRGGPGSFLRGSFAGGPGRCWRGGGFSGVVREPAEACSWVKIRLAAVAPSLNFFTGVTPVRPFQMSMAVAAGNCFRIPFNPAAVEKTCAPVGGRALVASSSEAWAVILRSESIVKTFIGWSLSPRFNRGHHIHRSCPGDRQVNSKQVEQR